MSEETAETTARRLIEDALGDTVGPLLDRVQQATAAFDAASDAYRNGDPHAAAHALEAYAASAESETSAVYDLCAVGATRTAMLIARRRSECGDDCTCGARLALPDDASDAFGITAVRLVNAASDQHPEAIAEILGTVHAFAGTDGVQTIATTLVDVHAQVSALVDEPG